MSLKVGPATKKEAPKGAPAPAGDSMQAVIKALQKEKGGSIGSWGGIATDTERLPTGLLPFDMASMGGLPRGRMSLVYGKESSGKTNLALKAIAIQQKLHPEQRCAFVAIEPFDTHWARHMGVDVDKLALIYPSYAEEAIDAVEALLFAVDCGVVCLDSIAAMITTQEAEKSAEGSNPGSSGLAGGKLVRKTTLALREAEKAGRSPSLICINQPRTKIGVMYGDPTTLPGGSAQYFQSALTVSLFGKNVIDKAVDPNKPCRKETIFTIKKNKCPILAEKGVFEMCTVPQKGLRVGDCNDWHTISSSLKEMGRLAKEGKDWMLDGQAYPVLEAIRDRVYTDQVFGTKIRSEIVQNAVDSGVKIEGDVSVDEDGVVQVEGEE